MFKTNQNSSENCYKNVLLNLFELRKSIFLLLQKNIRAKPQQTLFNFLLREINNRKQYVLIDSIIRNLNRKKQRNGRNNISEFCFIRTLSRTYKNKFMQAWLSYSEKRKKTQKQKPEY